jgi:hypothetical protein
MCFNGAKSRQTVWYSTKIRVVAPSVGSCFNENLYSVANFSNSASSVVLVKINDNLSDTEFYITFNRHSRINLENQEGVNQVLVTHQAAGSGMDLELVAKLSAGGVWNGVSDGIISVSILSINCVASGPHCT